MTTNECVLTRRVSELGPQLTAEVAAGRWTDATLTAAAVWQAADDALGSATSPLLVAAGKLGGRRQRPARAASAALGAVGAARSLRPGDGEAERWRRTLMSLATVTAGLAVREADPEPDLRPRADLAARLSRDLGSPPPGVRRAITRICSSFRAFDQHPDDVAALVDRVAERWPDRHRPVLVVGVRTSGSYLAVMTAAALERAGYRDVAVASARPGHPMLPADVRAVRLAARRDGLALVVDDPPASGDAVATVCWQLTRTGLRAASVVPVLALFDDTAGPPGALSRFPCVTLPWDEWSIHRRLGPATTERVLRDALRVREVRVEGELPAPGRLPRTHARTSYRVHLAHEDGTTERGTVLAVGTGLGWFGRFDTAVAHELKGHVPPVLAHVDSVLYLQWPESAAPVDASAETVVEYVAARHERLGVPVDVTPELRGRQPVWEVASNHLARAYGRLWPVARLAVVDRLTRGILLTAEPSVPDGDMRPQTWLGGEGTEGPVKASFSERSFSNFDLLSFDDRFDVVGAAVHGDEAGYGAGYRAGLRLGYEQLTGRRISPERWLAYELVHLWDLQRLAGVDRATVDDRKARAVRRYLAEVLLAGLPPVEAGPVVALDVDGVLETDGLGFRAPTPTSVLALRALRAHGYRTVVVTGRSLDDVVDIATTFGLSGGAAEYGSVVHRREPEATTRVVDDAGLAALALARTRLEQLPSLRIAPQHRHSLRISVVDDSGDLRGWVPDPRLVPSGLRAVRGQEQTDLVAVGVDKAVGARVLLRQLGEERPVLAVGDTVADVEVLTWADRSVVPRHADRTTRAAAGFVARRPYQAGLADAVTGLIGHRPGGCVRCRPPEPTPAARAVLDLLRIAESRPWQVPLRSLVLARSVARLEATAAGGAEP